MRFACRLLVAPIVEVVRLVKAVNHEPRDYEDRCVIELWMHGALAVLLFTALTVFVIVKR